MVRGCGEKKYLDRRWEQACIFEIVLYEQVGFSTVDTSTRTVILPVHRRTPYSTESYQYD